MIDIIEKTIHSRYHLDRDAKQWLIQEGQQIVRLKTSDRQSFGFSLENRRNPPLAFFGDAPPEDIAKMCDGMLAVVHGTRLYLLAIELKSGYKDDARKQLANGRLFWCWLMELYREYGHLPTSIEVFYVSLLAWQPREESSLKETSTHSARNELQKLPKVDGFNACFEARNQEDISLADLIRQCRRIASTQGEG